MSHPPPNPQPTDQDGQPPPPPSFTMAFAMPGPRRPPQQGQQEGQSDTQDFEDTTFIWTFEIGQDAGPPETDGQPSGQHPPLVNSMRQGPPPHIPDNESARDGGSGGLPPWMFRPLYHVFIPLEGPQPNSEKAAELLKSLPTVDEDLLQRVDKVFAAQDVDSHDDDDEKGWKCGICLEGIAKDTAESGKGKETCDDEGKKEEDQGTGVKALPCNHLYHGNCLEPWFTSYHTCPTCRLNLDPLQTLNAPPRPTRGESFRPGRSGSGRTTLNASHPYRRAQNGEPSQAEQRNGESNEVASEQPSTGPSTRTGSTPVDGASIGDRPSQAPRQRSFHHSFFFGAASPHHRGPRGDREGQTTRSESAPRSSTGPPDAAAPPVQEDRSGTSQTSTSGSPAVHMQAPLGFVFGGPTLSSPMPLEGQSTPASSAEHVTSQSAHPPPQASSSAINPDHPQSATTASTSPDAEPRTQPASERPPIERRSHINFLLDAIDVLSNHFDNPPPFPLPFPPPSPFQDQSREGRPAGTAPTTTGSRPGEIPAPPVQEGGSDGDSRPHTRKSTKKPFVPQTLESWTQEKEKSLGWRCDAPKCVYSPIIGTDASPDLAREHTEKDERGKVLVSISGGTEKDQDQVSLVACPHQWHIGCIEVAEEDIGEKQREGGDKKAAVTCGRCRKDRRTSPEKEPTEGSGIGRKRKEEEMSV